MSMFEQNQNFKVFCIDGAISNNKGRYTIGADITTLLVTCMSSNDNRTLMAILTTDPAYKEYNQRYIDMKMIKTNTIYSSLYLLLKNKFDITHNLFSISFAGNRETVEIAAECGKDDQSYDIVCTVRGVNGDVVVKGDSNIKCITNDCKDVRSFSHTTSTADIVKTISVMKGRGEIYREIAHYLNRTLVLTSFDDDGRVIEQYIGSSGILEVIGKFDKPSYFNKVSSTNMMNVEPFCVSTTTDSVDDVMRKHARILSRSQAV